jgi:hypothetical protein
MSRRSGEPPGSEMVFKSRLNLRSRAQSSTALHSAQRMRGNFVLAFLFGNG